ncbi:MAG TPA: FAD-dependent oxidoreductase [Terriglobales bacterium]|nr:FAD-dependent oxidoreductase [Terriglobales bacterium]
MKRKLQVAVVGAGVFGGWTALYLLRRGAGVTLIDAWGPGNSRASSGGETRVIRGTYGPDQPYTRMAARALTLWSENERKWKLQFLRRIGVLWMAAGGSDAWERGSLDMLKEAQIPHERLSGRELAKRCPQINFEGVEWGVFEPESGFLRARVACRGVVEGFVAEGGVYRQTAVVGGAFESGPWKTLALSDGSDLKADRYVFACGPWMGKLFPESIGSRILSTKQDVFFFGPPPGDSRFDDQHLPVWADHRGRFMYGIPGNQGRGFKIADDTRGPEFDPTTGERVVSAERLQLAREYMAFRFPGMKDAPLLEARVCQYEQTADSHFIIDRHPAADHVWLVGGGSGHGFKHGPALGEMVAKLVIEEKQPEPQWRLERFSR